MLHRTRNPSGRTSIVGAVLTVGLVCLVIGCGGGSTSSGTSTTAGVLPANVIFFIDTTDQGATTNYRQVNPDGTGQKLLYSFPAAFQAITLNPVIKNQIVFGYSPNAGVNAKYGIYKNSSVSATSVKQIVAPVYRLVSEIQVSPDGSTVYYIAAIGSGNTELYKVPITGGVPVVLNSDAIFSMNVDEVDGSRITYDKVVKYSNGNFKSTIIVQPTKNTGVPVELNPDSSANYACPQFSKDGSKIVFTSDKADAQGEVYVMNSTDGSNMVQVTSNPTINKLYNGCTFSADGTKVAYIGFDTAGSAYGVYESSLIGGSGSSTNIVNDLTINPGINWTSAAGLLLKGSTNPNVLVHQRLGGW